MKFKRFDKRFLPMLWIGLVLWLGTILVMFILEKAGVEFSGQETLYGLAKVMFRNAPIFTLLLLCLFQPILEEMSFRLWGVGKKWTYILCIVLMALFTVSSVGLWGILLVAAFICVTLFVKNRFWQVWLNALISSFAFMVCHISGFGSDLLGMIIGLIEIFGMALVCCWLTVNLSFWFSCLLHVLNNSLGLVLPLIFLNDPQTSRITVSFEDGAPIQACATEIEPLNPFADNSALYGGEMNLSQISPNISEFYLVGEPAEIACKIASQKQNTPADVYYDWKSRDESLEERVVFRVKEMNPDVFFMHDLFDHYVYEMSRYLDEPFAFDTSEVMLKEIWLVYDDGREVQLNDTCEDFSKVFGRIVSSPYGIRGNEIIEMYEEVNDSTVEKHYYCRLRENPMQDELNKLTLTLDKLNHYNYRIDYRDGRKVTYITIH